MTTENLSLQMIVRLTILIVHRFVMFCILEGYTVASIPNQLWVSVFPFELDYDHEEPGTSAETRTEDVAHKS